ncbi:SDR family oxidoreductase [Gordonia hankookensis]|uniref:SDR family oxidoreductase n=1 Tax=Gordonia hankookensis TaxID=589403 RepID=A0ABR7WEX4_9ACTN|nr:SDR family oxidoreductase [Gordonia hankookensis]MBD1321106.1 SDR family oxidoreductase [Gordonia hankookensis]
MSAVGVVTGAGRGMGFECAKRLTTMVDTLVLVDYDGATVTAAAEQLSADGGAVVEPVVLDITDVAGLGRLAARVRELGTLRAVAHVAGISPTMADWQRIFTVDLVGTATLADALRPLATVGTAWICFASMAPTIGGVEIDTATAAVLDDPLHEHFLDRIRESFGPMVEHPGVAYSLAKLGVKRFAQQEAVRLGPSGGRICSISPGLIDTPQGRQEAADNPRMAAWAEQTPLARLGQAHEVAAVAAFVLSDAASFLNGIDLLVDGGLCAAVRGPQPRSAEGAA